MLGPQYLIMTPLAASFIITFFGNRLKYAAQTLAVLSASALAIISLSCAKYVPLHKAILFKVGNWSPPFGIPLFCDGFSAFILVAVNLVTLAVVLYSIGYANQYTDKWKYYALLMIMSAGVNGVVLTGDIFNLFVFLEIASIATYALVAFTTEDEALEGAFKYAVMSAIASCFILLGIAFLYSYTSTLNMADMASVLSVIGPRKVIPFVSVLFIMGFGLKSALAPFHAWAPDAYTKAPATIAAMSSGVLIKALGIYSLARIFFDVFGMSARTSYVLIALAVLSMVVGSVLAYGQSNIRRLLAYSTVSQVGYILLAFGIGTPLAIMGGIFHILNHSVAKSLLLLNAGIVESYFGTSDINKISGVVEKDRVCGYTNLIAAGSVCGIPPLAGFWSKVIIIFACIQAHHPILAFIAVIVSILTLVYYFKAYTPMLFSPGASDSEVAGYKINFTMKFATLALALVAVLGGLALIPGPVNALMNSAVSVLVNGSAGYLKSVLGVIK